MQHKLSEQETRAIRLCHHDHAGFTRKRTAELMDISEQRLSNILHSAKIKAPQLFPILTQNQKRVCDSIVERGQDRESIAFFEDWPISKVDAIIAQLRKKGVSLTIPKTVRYEPHMDGQVRRKF